MPQFWDITSSETLDNFLEYRSQMVLSGNRVRVEFVDGAGTRTPSQNASLHRWLRLVAQALNDAGFSVMTTLRHDAEIPWTEHSAKELLWRPVQEAMTGKESSADCNKVEYSGIEQVIVRHLGEKTGITLPPWPSRESEHEK